MTAIPNITDGFPGDAQDEPAYTGSCHQIWTAYMGQDVQVRTRRVAKTAIGILVSGKTIGVA